MFHKLLAMSINTDTNTTRTVVVPESARTARRTHGMRNDVNHKHHLSRMQGELLYVRSPVHLRITHGQSGDNFALSRPLYPTAFLGTVIMHHTSMSLRHTVAMKPADSNKTCLGLLGMLDAQNIPDFFSARLVRRTYIHNSPRNLPATKENHDMDCFSEIRYSTWVC